MSGTFRLPPFSDPWTTRQQSPVSDEDDELTEIFKDSVVISRSSGSDSINLNNSHTSFMLPQTTTPCTHNIDPNYEHLVDSLRAKTARKIDSINQAFTCLITPYQTLQNLLQNLAVSDECTLTSDTLLEVADVITASSKLFTPPPDILPHMMDIATQLQGRAQVLSIHLPAENLLALSQIYSFLFYNIIDPMIPILAKYKHEAQNLSNHIEKVEQNSFLYLQNNHTGKNAGLFLSRNL